MKNRLLSSHTAVHSSLCVVHGTAKFSKNYKTICAGVLKNLCCKEQVGICGAVVATHQMQTKSFSQNTEASTTDIEQNLHIYSKWTENPDSIVIVIYSHNCIYLHNE
eukprot:c12534_g3_i1.p1 GENE.c12534_g3_i1~~c12534_g3_i1.p1  ORF type:complete len:107 (-),score=2.88 c12534_g3_i1:341-661(-)